MPVTSTALTAAALGLGGAFGIYKGGEAISKTLTKRPDMPFVGVSTTPSATGIITSSEDAARKALEQRRRVRALSGGKTLLTDETLGSSSTTQPKSLLGS